MKTGTTLFSLRLDHGEIFDGSTIGLSILKSPNAKALPRDRGVQIDRGHIEIARHKALDDLQAFTIETTIVPQTIAGQRRNILEAQSPAVALFLEADGRIIGSVNTAAGWVGVDSGQVVVREGQTARIRFTRDAGGASTLEVNGQRAGTKNIPGPIRNVGDAGFKIGAWVDGQRFPFVGSIEEVQVVNGVVGPQFAAQKAAAAQQIAAAFRAKTGLTQVAVELMPDPARARLQAVRDIMQAAGVQKLSDLSTLQIKQQTVMSPGKVLVAPKAGGGAVINWSQVAQGLVTGTVASKRIKLAQTLTNRNSATVLRQATTPVVAPSARIVGPAAPAVDRAALRRLPVDVRRDSLKMRLDLRGRAVSEVVAEEGGKLKILDADLLKKVEGSDPASWPALSAAQPQFLMLKTIPIDSAVIIANTLDLTNNRLLIEPSVRKLYIIAEKVICGPNAAITWRRPGGTTQARANDRDLDGRGWSGVQTNGNSRHGLSGENGRDGTTGINGARGVNAPELELWVKDLSAIPDIDLSGENGITGGRGQRGGRGGNGADGEVGTRFWLFGWHCSADPGDGGDGGDGGRGGAGGRGGNGANGGAITIGVLEGTLAATVTNKSFKIKNQGGTPAQGGEGGAGGSGGSAGRSGNGETCQGARNGRAGAQGQPGARGATGSAAGADGQLRFFEFDEDDWEELLTRPWLSQISPPQAFPGDRVTLRGSQFTTTDRVFLGGTSLVPTENPDQSISINVPVNTTGGDKSIFVRRPDGTESNRLTLRIKPQLDALPGGLGPNADITLTGRAFLANASVLLDGTAVPATVAGATSLTFRMPGTGGGGSTGGSVTVQVRNPDGLVSNSRTGTRPRILEIPFRYGVHNLVFDNFSDGVPDWGTFEDTYGAAEVWHELLDPVFGHPILTGAFYFFYEHFLKGTANGGLATGFCTSLASLVTDKFWKGETDATTVTKASVHKLLTGVHGKLLSRESLLHFHEQGREGVPRVERTAREIESTFLRGCDRQNAPLLFFIPSGAAWDAGYFDRLSDSHCVMPYSFEYPAGHPGPQLSGDLSTTITSLDGVQMRVWDCNEPQSPNCRLVFRLQDGQLHFDYFPNTAAASFSSTNGITLGMMTNGAYMLSDHDLPFSGPLGLTTFVLDFLLSPADLQITDGLGLRTGNFAGQIVAEIPDSHPCYLVPGMYMLPANTALTRRIRGTGNGTYTFNSVMPDGGALVMQNVTTAPGQEDVVSVNEDGTQIRITPATTKTFNLTLSRQVGGQARAVTIRGAGAAPGAEVDLTVSPELSVVRLGNRGAARSMEVRAFTIDKTTNAPVRKQFGGINVAAQHDLLVAVPDWNTLNVDVQTLAFE